MIANYATQYIALVYFHIILIQGVVSQGKPINNTKIVFAINLRNGKT